MQEATVIRHGVVQSTQYDYDALGRRIAKRDAFGRTDYLWDGDLLVHTQRGSIEALFVFEPNSFIPLATIQDNETYWYQCDSNGMPLELTNQLGGLAWAIDARTWGEASRMVANGVDWTSANSPLQSGRPISQPFRFQGQQFDEETGLHYNRHRYYDPVSARYTSQDPIGLDGGNNVYQYGPNSIAWTDPLGLAKICCCGAPFVDANARWTQIMNEPNTPRATKGWIKNQLRQIAAGKQRDILAPPGLELAHRPRFENERGFDYSHADPMWAADHRGIQHRYWRERGGCWTAKMPASGPRGNGKLSLPKPGSLP